MSDQLNLLKELVDQLIWLLYVKTQKICTSRKKRVYKKEDGTKVAEAIKRITETASTRIAKMAYEIALQREAVRKGTSGKQLHENHQ